jgi:hypothetical protein
VSVATGQSRALTRSPVSRSFPAFAGADVVLFVRSDQGKNEIWRVRTDGTGEERLAEGCDRPEADPAGRRFLCLGGTQDNVVLTANLSVGSPQPLRPVKELGGSEKFIYARFNATGSQIYAVTTGRRILTIDAASGAEVRDEAVPFDEGAGSNSLLAAVFNEDATIQAYSVSYLASRLYLVRGL